MNYNKVQIAGNFTRDPEVKYTPSGIAICNFSLAVNRRYNDKQGNKKEEVSFFDCVAFGITGDNIQKHFSRGKNIFVEGILKQERWEDRNGGGARSKIVVQCESFQFTQPKASEESQNYSQSHNQNYNNQSGNYQNQEHRQGRQQPAQPQQSRKPVATDYENYDDEDDIPF